MNNLRLTGRPEKLGLVSACEEFLTWEVPDIESTGRMRRLLKHMGKSTLVLDAMKYHHLELGSDAHATFIEVDGFGAGRDQSAHQVRFGQLLLNGKNFREQSELVAVKPYSDRRSLYREWAAHEYLNSLFDRQIGYINLGVHRDKKGRESIVSQYDHDVISFDSSFWAGPETPISALRPAVLQRHAALGARGLGLMHGVRMTHGDAQIKNLAADRLGPRAIDLETANILDAESIDDPTALGQTRRDLSVFIDSLGRVEDNMDYVTSALSSGGVVESIVSAYGAGVVEGRAALNGEYVPNFGMRNQDVIREELEKLTR